MKRAPLPGSCLALLMFATPLQAAIEVTFTESAPKDRFVITNTGACTVEGLEMLIDLGPSAGGLYFDTTGAGAGVQVYQPFEVARGELRLLPRDGAGDGVEDGQNMVRVQIARLAVGATAEFTIDVDDSVVNGALGRSRVASAEIAGARIQLDRPGQPPLEARFDASGRAATPPLPCP